MQASLCPESSFRSFSLLPASLLWLALPAPVIAQAEHLEISLGNTGDQFGFSVAIDAEQVLVGMPGSDTSGTDSGSLALFHVLDGSLVWQWSDSGGQSFDALGTSVALHGDFALVGVPQADDLGSASGAAWLVDVGLGIGTIRLVAADGEPGDRMGMAVALGESVAALGCSTSDAIGSVVLFDTTSGQEITRLVPSTGAEGDRFGASLALSGDVLVVGAYFDSQQAEVSGAAYLFDVKSKTETMKLFPADPQAGGWFGRSVAIGADQVAIGAPHADGVTGAVYLFDRVSGAQLAKFSAPGLEANDLFGWSVAFSGSKLLIGAPGDDEKGAQAGALYLVDPLVPDAWTKVFPAALVEDEIFGSSVAASSDYLLGGAPQHALVGPGSVFVFHSYFDCNGNGVPDDEDISNGTSLDADGNGVPDECECQGVNYCVANQNSTGKAAHMSWSGSLSVSTNDLVLLTTDCPATKPALYFYGPDTVQVPFGNGWRCVGGRLFRLPPLLTNSSGLASYSLDNEHLPPEGDIAVGSSWNFQLWYRDPQGGGAAFNLSDGLTLEFCD